MKYCSSCGQPVGDAARFCAHCGAAQTTPEDPIARAAAQAPAAPSAQTEPWQGWNQGAPAEPRQAPQEPWQAPQEPRQAPQEPWTQAPAAPDRRWGAAVAVLSVLYLLFALIQVGANAVFYTRQGVHGSAFFSLGMNLLLALAAVILYLAPTRQTPVLTAIPRLVGLLLSGLSIVLISHNLQNPQVLLSLGITLLLAVLYLVGTLQKPTSTGIAVAFLVCAILSALYSLASVVGMLRMFGYDMDLRWLYLGNVAGSLGAIFYAVASAVALFRLRPKAAAAAPGYAQGFAPNGYAQPGAAPQRTAQAYGQGYAPQDAPSGGYAALGFFFPVIGLILYLVWKDQTPLRARSAGKGALIGVIVSVVGSVLLSVLYILLMAGSLRYLY